MGTEAEAPDPQVGRERPKRGRVVWEVLGLYALTLMGIKGVVALQSGLGLPADVLVVVPLLFLGVPILWIEHLKEDPADYGLLLERVQLGPALLLNLKVWAIVLPVFLLANHAWQGLLGHRLGGVWPVRFWTDVVAYHLFFVAFPEEFFYRGYMQGRLGRVFERPWRLFGVSLGPAWVLTTLLFTVGHSIVTLRWWHFAIVVPSLLFGWMKEKTGSVLAGALCHAFSNILMVVLETRYGVIRVG